MNILLDMNLSPLWVYFLQSHGIEAVHWSAVGNPKAPDNELFAWAKEHGYFVFTNDLDFGAILAATRAGYPSVIQVRAQGLLPADIGDQFLKVLIQFEDILQKGALVTFDERRSRAKVLPIQSI